MPFYDLKCRECGEEFNVMAKMSERSQKTINCPKCGKTELDAIFTNINIAQSKKPDTHECPNINKCGGCCNHG